MESRAVTRVTGGLTEERVRQGSLAIALASCALLLAQLPPLNPTFDPTDIIAVSVILRVAVGGYVIERRPVSILLLSAGTLLLAWCAIQSLFFGTWSTLPFAIATPVIIVDVVAGLIFSPLASLGDANLFVLAIVLVVVSFIGIWLWPPPRHDRGRFLAAWSFIGSVTAAAAFGVFLLGRDHYGPVAFQMEVNAAAIGALGVSLVFTGGWFVRAIRLERAPGRASVDPGAAPGALDTAFAASSASAPVTAQPLATEPSPTVDWAVDPKPSHTDASTFGFARVWRHRLVRETADIPVDASELGESYLMDRGYDVRDVSVTTTSRHVEFSRSHRARSAVAFSPASWYVTGYVDVSTRGTVTDISVELDTSRSFQVAATAGERDYWDGETRRLVRAFAGDPMEDEGDLGAAVGRDTVFLLVVGLGAFALPWLGSWLIGFPGLVVGAVGCVVLLRWARTRFFDANRRRG
jgi:hypothetical protein